MGSQFDWDYGYSVDVFKFQLLKMAEHFESENATGDSLYKAKRIRTIIRLMDKVYNEEYLDYNEEVERLYGKINIDFVQIDNEYYEMITTYERDYSEEEIKKIENHISEMRKFAIMKQERAHKLLWELVEHNIRNLWD